ncbi:MAG: S49 family peptidase [Amphritea sp.]|nr:S49 family peptidase [Amphritea sp.]
MQNMPHIASRVLNTPLLLEPGYARTFFSALAPRLGIMELQDDQGVILTGEAMRQSAKGWSSDRERNRPYQIIDGVAVLPVQGTLAHKYGHTRPYSGMTGYDGIIRRMTEACDDPDVKGVLLDNDTPGGEVSGCFNTSRKLRQMADAAGKPLWALCYDMNCSAGMALASAAHRRLINETGIAGSVGVVMAHADWSQNLEQDGINVTLIHSGAHKVDGNPYEALSAEVLARFQSKSDELRNEFAELVAGHMGMSVADVLATEAATYRGQAAIDIGFADELVNGIDAVSIFSQHLSTQGRTISIGATMSEDNLQPQADTSETNGPAAGADQQVPEVGAQDAAKLSAQGAADMQARIAGILQCESAKGRETTANHLAFNTNMSVEEAEKLLATVPLGTTTDAMNTALDNAMSAEDQPEVGADAGASDDENDEVAQFMGAYKTATGVGK